MSTAPDSSNVRGIRFAATSNKNGGYSSASSPTETNTKCDENSTENHRNVNSSENEDCGHYDDDDNDDADDPKLVIQSRKRRKYEAVCDVIGKAIERTKNQQIESAPQFFDNLKKINSRDHDVAQRYFQVGRDALKSLVSPTSHLSGSIPLSVQTMW